MIEEKDILNMEEIDYHADNCEKPNCKECDLFYDGEFVSVSRLRVELQGFDEWLKEYYLECDSKQQEALSLVGVELFERFHVLLDDKKEHNKRLRV